MPIVMIPWPVFRPESYLLKESVGPHKDRPSVTAVRIHGHESPSHLPKGQMVIHLGKVSRLFKYCWNVRHWL